MNDRRPYKELFERLKLLGLFGDYESYEAYRAAKEIDNTIEPPKNIEGWKQILSEEDKQKYNKMFGD